MEFNASILSFANGESRISLWYFRQELIKEEKSNHEQLYDGDISEQDGADRDFIIVLSVEQ